MVSRAEAAVRIGVCAVAAIVVVSWYGATTLAGQSGAGAAGEWRYHGGDAGSTKYSPLDQINRDNVKDLRIAWRWKTENFGPLPDFRFQVTPLMVGGVLYTTAGMRRSVAAIDAATGETLWMFRYDEGMRGQRAPVRPAAGRGLAYWTDSTNERILYITRGYHLIQLDAQTGHLVPTFGNGGIVDLYDGLDQPRPSDGEITSNSPPIVVGDVVVVGAALRALAPSEKFLAGFIRGYDVRSGKRAWIFHTIPRPGEFGNDTWENDSWSYTGNTGAWAPMSADIRPGNRNPLCPLHYSAAFLCGDQESGTIIDELRAVPTCGVPSAASCRERRGGVGVTKNPERSSMNYVPCPPAGCPPPPPAGNDAAASASIAEPAATSAEAAQGCGYNGPQGLPLVKPPWGRITAIDLNKGEHVWMVPNGEAPDCVKNHPLLKGVALPRTGKADRSGVLVTKTLLFAGEGGGFRPQPAFTGGPIFRALDKQNGATLWEFTLPANQEGGPITYMVGEKQYIVVPVGMRGTPAELVALALP